MKKDIVINLMNVIYYDKKYEETEIEDEQIKDQRFRIRSNNEKEKLNNIIHHWNELNINISIHSLH